MQTHGNLALKEPDVNLPPMRPPPVGAVKVTMTIEFIDSLGSQFIGHTEAGLVRSGQKVDDLVLSLIDKDAIWFSAWWQSAHAAKFQTPQED